MIDPVLLFALITGARITARITDAFSDWLLLHGRAELARAAGVRSSGRTDVSDSGPSDLERHDA